MDHDYFASAHSDDSQAKIWTRISDVNRTSVKRIVFYHEMFLKS